MLIGKDRIREIVERTDIVEMVGRHVELRRAGRSYKGLCPFHGEKSPSFYVTPERRSYKCFGCQKGGDVIRFVMEYEGKDFLTAVRELAAAAGVPLETNPEEDRRRKERRELLWACEVAARFFADTLWSAAGAPGREHLAKRGVSEAIAREAGLGYAPPGFHALHERLRAERVPEAAAVAAGLLAAKPDGRGTRHFDVFRGRLMVPIRDPDGRVIAFGGRIVEGEDDRKYINTRETSLYVKGKVLYGLDTARDAIRRTGEAVLVEGYFDAIALREAGVKTAVALCSTALTPDHVALLQRLEVRQVRLLLDGDDAGRKGAVRIAAPLLAAGLTTHVVLLPDGHDPDTFLRASGRAGYDRMLSSARPLSTHVIESAVSGDGYEARMRALHELRAVVAGLPEGAARSLFLAEVARTLGLPAKDVASFFQGQAPRAAPQPAAAPAPHRPGPRAPSAPPAARRELELTACLLAYRDARARLASEAAAQLGHPALREIAAGLADGLGEDELLSQADPALARALQARVSALMRAPAEDPLRVVEDGLLHVTLERLREERRAAIDERDALERELGHAPAAERTSLADAIEDCKRRVTALLSEMERTRVRIRGESPG